MSRAPKARAEKISSIMCKFYAKMSFVPSCSALSAQKNGVFSECSKVAHLRIHWFCARFQNKEKRCLRAPKARAEKIWSILREFYAKAPLAPLCLAQIAQNTQYFENTPKSLIYEYEGFMRASRTKRNDARERRRRERRKFGAFYASFTQMCLSYHCAWQKVQKKRSVFRVLQSHSFTNTLVSRAPPEQRESDVASAEGASGENLEHYTQVLCKSVFCTIGLGKKCSKNGVSSECSKVTHLRIRWFCARP